jgi:hypothetical protein
MSATIADPAGKALKTTTDAFGRAIRKQGTEHSFY